MTHPDGSTSNTSVSEFFSGKSVFLTGGTGFIGKQIIEKLLRTCKDIRNIYLLVRPKKGKTCTERIQHLFQLPLFTKLNEINPSACAKVIPIPGDISCPYLGISDVDRQTLCDDVHIVIHSAASTSFVLPLRTAMQLNCIAVKYMIELVKEISNLEVFCHISTAYSQCSRTEDEVIYEKFYPAPTNVHQLINTMEWMPDDMLNNITKQLLRKFPNTYTFAKALSEALLEETAKDLPLVIVRPSVVCASLDDPIRGWIERSNAFSSMMVALGFGISRTYYVPEVNHDIVPVDLVSNCIISAIWYKAHAQIKTPLIVNCTSGGVNPHSFFDMEKPCKRMLSKYPYNGSIRNPNFSFTRNKSMYTFWKLMSHYIPAYVIDSMLYMTGSEPRLVDMYRRMDRNEAVFHFFTSTKWLWDNTHYACILDALSDDDKMDFDFDMRRIDWEGYYEALTVGVKVHVLKEELTNEVPKKHWLLSRL